MGCEFRGYVEMVFVLLYFCYMLFGDIGEVIDNLLMEMLYVLICEMVFFSGSNVY